MGAIQQRLPKNRRAPEAVAGKRVTERGIEIIKTIARYRFLLARDIVRLVGGNEDVTHRHLQQLYHQDLVGRFTLPEPARHGEFIYFLDNPSGLRQLAEASKLVAEKLPWDEIRQNREKYSQRESHSVGRFLFIQHELMIIAFHAARYFYLQKSAYGGRVARQNYAIHVVQRPNFSTARLHELIEYAHERLSRVQIERLPYEKVLARYDRAETFFYLDPPYYNIRLYQHNLEHDDFVRMAGYLKEVKGKFLLSLNDRPEVREIFSAFDIMPVTVSYSLNRKAGKHNTELLIKNY